MTLPETVRIIRWMIWDTFRQSMATKVFWAVLVLIGISTLFALSVKVSGDPAPVRYDWEVPAVLPRSEVEKIGADNAKNDGVRVITGEISLGFGAFKTSIGRSREDSVKFLQIWFAGALADTVGLLIALLWTAGFVPTFLEPQSATILLAKPAPRWSLLLGKYLGVIGFVSLQATAYILFTWLGFGVSTGVWNTGYWMALPVLILNFTVFFSVSTYLAVWTRSATVATFGTLLFWIVCWAINYTHYSLLLRPLAGMGENGRLLLDAVYWALPKPLDFSTLFFDAMNAEGFVLKVEEVHAAQKAGNYSAEGAILSSLGFALVTTGLSTYELNHTDY